MFDALIKAIQDSVTPSVLTLRGDAYSSRELHLPPKAVSMSPLHISTLEGLKSYLSSHVKEADLGDEIFPAIHIISPTRVQLVSHYDVNACDRHEILMADCNDILGRTFQFGQWLDQERFIIELQSKFLDEGDRARVLEYIGNISKDNSVQTLDDGVSQSTTVKKALGRVGHEEFENPVSLAPYRTFHEVPQPPSEFVLRMREGRDGVELALFDSEAGRWKLEAIHSIKGWLEQNIALEELGISVIA